jgi:hypothetical protein
VPGDRPLQGPARIRPARCLHRRLQEGSIPPGAPYFAEIVSIDIAGDTAVVKLIDDYLGVRFTDYLTMVMTEGRWVIVNKVFYVHPDGA